MPQNKAYARIIGWLESKKVISERISHGCFFISFGNKYDGPTELAVYDDGRWELSFESRVDEIYEQNKGLKSLKKVLKPWRDNASSTQG